MRCSPLLSLVLCTACGGIPAIASSTFEGDAEGWTLTGNGSEGRVPDLRSQGGNPGGHICGADQSVGELWFFSAPRKYLGNASKAYGQRLIFDLKQNTSFNQLRAFDVSLSGGGYRVVKLLRGNPRLDWTPNTVTLDDTGGWQVETAQNQFELATSEVLSAVLRNLNALNIRGEFVDGPGDEACLDNVYFGTP
jgi:hypothetical protein